MRLLFFKEREREERRRNKNKINIIRNKRDENILKTINLLILLENIHYLKKISPVIFFTIQFFLA